MTNAVDEVESTCQVRCPSSLQLRCQQSKVAYESPDDAITAVSNMTPFLAYVIVPVQEYHPERSAREAPYLLSSSCRPREPVIRSRMCRKWHIPSMPMLMQSDFGKSPSAVIWSRRRVVETCGAAG